VNFENPNFNVGLPVFTIHGNHDDPAGTDNLSAVDILATGSLVNYFGKAPITGEGAGKVRIAPVLLQKGETKLAMYGLGNLRDERLCRLFSTPNSVEWVRPAPTPDSALADWFNIFVLHQNRIAHTQAAKNCVREGHLARFLDLVVWGHEHECLADPWESVEGGGVFSVMQPGSSVATALSEGESKRKHVVLLEIMGNNWRTIKFPLETVRPFAFDSVTLGGKEELDPERPETVSAFLSEKVTSMIEEASRSRGPRTPELPLVRLRVDYTGFSTINTQRFGQKFVGKVANPQDIILWQKAALRRTKAERDAAAAATAAGVAAIRTGTLDETRIEDLIAIHLKQNLEVLPEAELTEALRDYVDKGQSKDALDTVIKHALLETQNAAEENAAADGGGAAGTSAAAAATAGGGGTEVATAGGVEGGVDRSEKQLASFIELAAAKRKVEATALAKKRRAEEAARDAAAAAAERTAAAARGTAAAHTTQAGDPTQTPRDAFDASDDDMPAPPPRGAGRGRGKAATSTKPSSSLAPTPNPRKRRVGGATNATAHGSQAVAPRARGGTSRSAATEAKKKLSAYKSDAVDDDRSGDEDVDEAMLQDEDEDMIEDSDDGGGKNTARGGRNKKQYDSDEDELMEEEREMVMASRQGGGAGGGGGRAGRRAGGGGAGGGGGGVASKMQGLGTADMPITLIDSDSDDEQRAEGVPNTTARAGGGRRPAAGGGGGTQGNGRSQLTFGRLGATASQQVSRWGTLK
jgi:double-strand break repair protein MRE11